MADHYPLSSHALHDAIAYGPRGAITTAQFLAQVQQLARRLPAGQYVLNTCSNRYHFLLGFAAAVVAEKTTLMPTTVTEQVLSQLTQNFPQNLFLLTDSGNSVHDDSLAALDLTDLVNQGTHIDPAACMPLISSKHLAAIVFTSGTTGSPAPHPKTWASLVHNARSAARRLASDAVNIVATVPGQHMYGFESSVLLALHGGSTLWHEKPFFPADIAAALARVPEPRMLVSTPFHLNTCIQSALAWSPLQTVLSATAPMSGELAQQVETQMQAPLHEIFGSTDTNQIASRRTLSGARWQLLDWAHLTQEEGTTLVHGICLPRPVRVGDGIVLRGEREFELMGRDTDQLNIAGKRNSLANMNQLLMRVPGVKDGCFFMPTPEEAAFADTTQVIRPCAFVVAAELSAQVIRAYLRQYVDPVFLPRPIWFVDRLPRNEASKLPRSALLALYRQYHSPTGRQT